MKFFKRLIILIIPLILLNSKAFAQIDSPVKGTIVDVIERIWKYLYWISFPLATLMLIIAAFYFVTASGNENQIKKGKDIILYTVIGLLVIILASGVVEFIREGII